MGISSISQPNKYIINDEAFDDIESSISELIRPVTDLDSLHDYLWCCMFKKVAEGNWNNVYEVGSDLELYSSDNITNSKITMPNIITKNKFNLEFKSYGINRKL